jgi:hypothetical protein
MPIQNLIRYYRACYQADNQSMSIFNFFSSSIQNRIFIEEREEFLSGFYPYLPIDQEKAEKLLKNIQIWGKEKETVYCSLFIAGKTDNRSKYQKYMFSPLLICPAEIIEKNQLYYLQPDKSRIRINHNALSRIFEDKPELDKSKLFEDLHNSIFGQDIDEGKIYEISEILKPYFEHLDSSPSVCWPELISESEARKKLKQIQKTEQAENSFELLPLSAACTINKSTDTRGILNELEAIADKESFSKPLLSLLNGTETADIKKDTSELGKIPTVLSKAQQKALENSSKYSVSVIVGPPGTGKTYTISTLAVEQMLKGKSVLIASRTDQAVDVIARKIEAILQNNHIIIRAGRKQYLRELRSQLEHILSGFSKTDNEHSSKQMYRDIKKLERLLKKKEKLFLSHSKNEISLSKLLTVNDKRLFDKLKLLLLQYKSRNSKELYKITLKTEALLDDKNEIIRQYIKQKYNEQIEESLKKDRSHLVNLANALKAGSGNKQEEIFEKVNFSAVFKLFPIWLVKMSDIYKVLPLQAELFDIAVIDEATQCDIASTLPILQRAKHTVFTGDPKQLRHSSFLSGVQQKILSDKYGLNQVSPELLNYRDNSILDICLQTVKEQAQINMLDEHFRSKPAIIRFSNQAFYQDRLRIMTANPLLQYNEGIKAVKLNGQRNKSGYNKLEADYILNEISKLIKVKDELGHHNIQSIGILSPFRDQAEYISRRIEQELSTEALSKYQISVGTAYSFQGEERDLMFISFALDNNSHFMAYRQIEKPDVFNVAVTRARILQYVVYSADTDQLPADSLLRNYLQGFELPEAKKKTAAEIKDRFAQEVKAELEQAGYAVQIAFPAAGFLLDAVISKNNKLCVIDLIGYPGQFADVFDTERYRILNRAGLKCFPLPYSRWLNDKRSCTEDIEDFMKAG